MKKQTPHITDEHIVAYLDGELHVSQDFERELRAAPELKIAAAEYTFISKALAASSRDVRFLMSAAVDSRALKVLRGITKSRKSVRRTIANPSAQPVRSVPASRSIKYLWAKRTAIGFAFASLLALILINFNGKNDQITQVPVPSPRSTPAPAIQAPASQVLPSENSSKGELALNNAVPAHPAPTIALKKNVVSEKNTIPNDLATNVTSQQAPKAAAHEQDESDPAAIMITHRYAKMIKSTPVVVVSEQDRMSDQERM